MEKLGVNSAACIAQFLDLQSAYSFLRANKRLFRYWRDLDIWKLLSHRPSPQSQAHLDPRFCIGDYQELRNCMWTRLPTSLLVPDVLRHFYRAVPVPTAHSMRLAQPQEDFIDYEGWKTHMAETQSDIVFRLAGPTCVFWIRLSILPEWRVATHVRIRLGASQDKWDYESPPIAVEGLEAEPHCLSQWTVEFATVSPPLVAAGAHHTTHKYQSSTVKSRSGRRQVSAGLVLVLPEVVVAEYGEVTPTRAPGSYGRYVLSVTGLPVASNSVDPARLAPPITAETVRDWSARLVSNPSLVHRDALTAMSELGAVLDYLRAVGKAQRVLTRTEVRFIADHFLSIDRFFDSMRSLQDCADELGTAMLAQGKARSAYQCFKRCGNRRGKLQCLLALREFARCLRKARRMKDCGVEELRKLAKDCGGTVETEFGEFLVEHSAHDYSSY